MPAGGDDDSGLPAPRRRGSGPAARRRAAAWPLDTHDIALKPGTSTEGYIRALSRALGHGYIAYTPGGPSVAAEVDTSLLRLMTLPPSHESSQAPYASSAASPGWLRQNSRAARRF